MCYWCIFEDLLWSDPSCLLLSCKRLLSVLLCEAGWGDGIGVGVYWCSWCFFVFVVLWWRRQHSPAGLHWFRSQTKARDNRGAALCISLFKQSRGKQEQRESDTGDKQAAENEVRGRWIRARTCTDNESHTLHPMAASQSPPGDGGMGTWMESSKIRNQGRDPAWEGGQSFGKVDSFMAVGSWRFCCSSPSIWFHPKCVLWISWLPLHALLWIYLFPLKPRAGSNFQCRAQWICCWMNPFPLVPSPQLWMETPLQLPCSSFSNSRMLPFPPFGISPFIHSHP